MTQRLSASLLTTKNLIRVGFTALSIASIGAAHSQTHHYQPPSQNYYQNNWIGD